MYLFAPQKKKQLDSVIVKVIQSYIPHRICLTLWKMSYFVPIIFQKVKKVNNFHAEVPIFFINHFYYMIRITILYLSNIYYSNCFVFKVFTVVYFMIIVFKYSRDIKFLNFHYHENTQKTNKRITNRMFTRVKRDINTFTTQSTTRIHTT